MASCTLFSGFVDLITVICIYMYLGASTMVLSEYAKLRILALWRDGLGPTQIRDVLRQKEGIETTRKSVSMFIARYSHTYMYRYTVCVQLW